MRVSRVEEQALRLAIRLARDGGQRTLQELAHGEGLPEPTVAKVLAELRDAGLVRAIRGRRGGYELTRPAAELTLAHLVQAVGPGRFSGRFCHLARSGAAGCERGDDCRLRGVWTYLEAQLFRVLDGITLGDLLAPEEQVLRHLDLLWRASERSGPGPLGEAVAG